VQALQVTLLFVFLADDQVEPACDGDDGNKQQESKDQLHGASLQDGCYAAYCLFAGCLNVRMSSNVVNPKNTMTNKDKTN
jgi:hypothetical protein